MLAPERIREPERSRGDRAVARTACPERIPGRGGRHDKLFFAQVREDADIELAAVEPHRRDHVVVITSGGCTALALLAAGAGKVSAVDSNITQNDVAELKAAALAHLPHADALALLGFRPASAETRLQLYRSMRPRLSAGARRRWDGRRPAVARGVIHSGRTERFLAVIVWIVTHLVISPGDVDALLGAEDIPTQRMVFETRWNGWRWRLLFRVLLNRRVCSRIYTPEFFEHVATGDFARYFRTTVERGLTTMPAATNPYLHLLLGRSAPGVPCLPTYATVPSARRLSRRAGDLALIDGTLDGYLDSLADGAVDAFCLSNICEWLPTEDIERLFTKIVRVASPDAVLVWRNFVGYTELPAALGGRIVVDQGASERLSRSDRSLLQARVVVASVNPTRAADHEDASTCTPSWQPRDATHRDNPALAALVRSNPIETHVWHVVDRSPDFGRLHARYPGSRVLVVDGDSDDGHGLVATASVLRRELRLGDSVRPMLYLGGVNRTPAAARRGVIGALATTVATMFDDSDAEAITWITNDTNTRVRALEERVDSLVDAPATHSIAEVDYTEVFPMVRQRPPRRGRVWHPRTDQDLEAISTFVNEHHRSHELYVPLSPTIIRRWQDDLPGFTLDDIIVLSGRATDPARAIQAVAVCYDPSPLVNIRVVRMDTLSAISSIAVGAVHRWTGLLPEPPRRDAHIRTLQIRYFAAQDATAGAGLLAVVNNRALDTRRHSISYVLDAREQLPLRNRFIFRYRARLSGSMKPAAAAALRDRLDHPVFLDVTFA